MRRGDFAAAWRVSDAILKERAGKPCWDWPRHEQYIWDGTPLAGKRVLVRCYHGLGDTIQFIRYAPLLRQIAARVTVWVQPVLRPLLSHSIEGVDEWLPLHDGTPDCVYDVDVELMELPHVFRTTLETIPGPVPYLFAEKAELPLDDLEGGVDRSRAARADVAPAPSLRVGLVWESGGWDARRSLPVDVVKTWMRLPGVRWFSLQRGPAQAQWRSEWGADLSSDDPAQTAAVMRALDLVISVDSMPAHLAGALGVPVWTLLHSESDWRWMAGREHSPW